MKVNVNTIRILFILVNLGVTSFIVLGYLEGLGVVGGADAASGFSGSSEGGLKSPAAFVYAESDYVQPESRESRLRSVASWLMPERPAPPVPVDSGPTEPVEEPVEEPETEPGKPIEGGPLQKENWQYVHGIILPGNLRDSWVRLEKKEENKSPTTSSSSSRFSRSRTSSSRSSTLRRSSSSSKIRSASSENIITLHLEDYRFKAEDKGLDFEFYVHHADENEIIYWTDNPKRMYSLPRVSKSYYIEETRGKTLEPKTEEEEGEEEEGETKEEKEKQYLTRFPLGTRPKDRRAEDYRRLLAGEESTGFLKTKNLGQEPAAKGSGPVRVRTPAPSTSGSRSSSSSYRKPSTAGTKAVPEKKPISKAEQSAQLGKALKDAEKSGKLTDSDRKQLGKIKDLLKGKDKK